MQRGLLISGLLPAGAPRARAPGRVQVAAGADQEVRDLLVVFIDGAMKQGLPAIVWPGTPTICVHSVSAYKQL